MLKRVTTDREMRQAVDPTTAGGEDMPSSGFGQKLKDLRERAHMSQAALGKALSISQTAYSNYENEKRYHAHPIPADKVMPLVSALVGKGTPPIRAEEIFEISELRGIQNILGGVNDKPVRASVPEEMGEQLTQANTIRIRFTIERGVYRDADAIHFANDLGRSGAPVLPLRNYPQDQQWGAVIVDNSGQRVGLPRHTLLHCVDAAALSSNDLPPGSIVVALRQREGLHEVVLCVVTGYTGRHIHLKDAATDQATDAVVLGAAVYRYGPVAQA